MNNNNDEVWFENPSVLLPSATTPFTFIPSMTLSKNANTNAITRLVLLISLALYMLNHEHYMTVLIGGLILVIFFYKYDGSGGGNGNDVVYGSGNGGGNDVVYGYGDGGGSFNEHFIPNVTEQEALDSGIRGFVPTYDTFPHGNPTQPCWFGQDDFLLNSTLEITPKIQFAHFDDAKRSYMNAKYELTPLTDTNGFKQIWRSEPEMQGSFSMTPDPLTETPIDNAPDNRGQCNYIVRSTIDHLGLEQEYNGLNSTRALAEAAYMQKQVDFREGLIGQHRDYFISQRQHNCPDMPLSAAGGGAGGSI